METPQSSASHLYLTKLPFPYYTRMRVASLICVTCAFTGCTLLPIKKISPVIAPPSTGCNDTNTLTGDEARNANALHYVLPSGGGTEKADIAIVSSFEQYDTAIQNRVAEKLPQELAQHRVTKAFRKFLTATSAEAQLDAQLANRNVKADAPTAKKEHSAIAKQSAPPNLKASELKDFANKLFDLQLKHGPADFTGSAANLDVLGGQAKASAANRPALNAVLRTYLKAYYDGNFYDRMGTAISKPKLPTSLNDLSNFSVPDSEIVAAETVLLEFLMDSIDPTPVMGDKANHPSGTTYYPGNSCNEPTALTANFAAYVALPADGCGITVKNVWVLKDLANAASDEATTVGGLVANTPGGISFGLGILGKVSIGDNQTLSNLVKTAASELALRATLATSYFTLRNAQIPSNLLTSSATTTSGPNCATDKNSANQNASDANAKQQLFSTLPPTFDQTPLQSQRLNLINALPTTKSVQLIRINPSALMADRMIVSLPETNALAMAKTGGVTADQKNLSWTGALQEHQPGGATFVSRNGEVAGSISTPRALYRITPLGGGVHALVQVDSTKFPKDEPESFLEKEKNSPTASHIQSLPRADVQQTEIDVLVAYTPSAKSKGVDMDLTITQAVAEANQSYVNSGISIHLNLVDSFQVSYSEATKSFDQILSDFVAMPDVNQRRDKSGADLAALIIDQSDYCGLADAVLADASTAFAVVYYDCATGYYSFAHELGHLMGARHNEQNDPSTTPFPYGHGYLHLSPPPPWRTIMAYDCPGSCQRLQYWSNSLIQYGGEPMGTAATNDNARVLNETAAAVAAFRRKP